MVTGDTVYAGILLSGTIWGIDRRTGRAVGAAAPAFHFQSTDCTGGPYIDNGASFPPQVALTPHGNPLTPGEPFFIIAGPPVTVTINSYDGGNGCTQATDTRQMSPLVQAGTVPGPFPAPLTIQ
jgi:hypothetical protein